jgi:hypothetical protein
VFEHRPVREMGKSTGQFMLWAEILVSSEIDNFTNGVLQMHKTEYRGWRNWTQMEKLGVPYVHKQRIYDLLASGFSVLLLLSGILAVLGVLNACARDLKTCFSFK